ncbi:DUF4349 domain-containing protein [Chloroflexota bacterium]
MKRLIIVLMLVVLFLVPTACAGAQTSSSPTTSMTAPEPALRPEPAPAEMAYSGDTVLPSAEERMIVRTGEISLVVEGMVDTRDEITQLALKFNGYVASSRISGEEQNMRGMISIRVPADEFDQVLAELRDLAVRVTSESTNSRDITEEYVDLESRLKNAEATESQYLALLEEAEVEETIRIYELLHQVGREIEQIKGHMQYLERTSSMSLIEVRLEPVATTKSLVRAGWSALEALKSAVRGIVTFGQWLGTIAIWLLIFTPVWGAIIGIIYWRRRKKKA